MMKKRIIMLILASALILSSFTATSCTVSVDVIKDVPEEEGVSETLGEESTEPEQEAEPEEKVYSRDELYILLKTELDKKSFGEEAEEYFFTVFGLLYTNYSSWAEKYRDLPKREEYIIENLINAVSIVDSVTIYPPDSDEVDEYDAPAWTEYTGEECNIFLVKSEFGETIQDDAEYFYHELTHARQINLLNDEERYSNYSFYQILIEGGATFHMKFVNEYTVDVFGEWCIENESSEYSINYRKENGLGYLIWQNDYEKLAYLSGYELLSDLESFRITPDEFIALLSEKYGEDRIWSFTENLKERYDLYEESFKGDRGFELSVEIENEFLDFIIYDIENAESKEELEEIEDMYEFYCEKHMPYILDLKENRVLDDYFKTEEVKEALSDAYDALTV